MARILAQALFLAAFVALVIIGKVQFWIALFLLGVAVSMLWGRLYCGWACPMHAVMRGIAWLKRKLGIKGARTPAFVKKPAVRIALVIVFVGSFAFLMVSGRQIPVLLILLGLSALVTIAFNESMWHRYLCPQGAILSVTARVSKNGLYIDQSCIGCGACARLCPAEAIVKSERYTVQTHECIRCGKCEAACTAKAIQKGGRT